MDIINRAMLFAAVLFLCFLPFVIIVQAFAGRSAATSLVRRFGLNRAAADAVSSVVTSPSATSSALTGLSYVVFVLGGLAAAGAIQELYERAFGLAPRGLKDTHRRLVWLAGLVAIAALASWAGPSVRSTGGPVLLGAVALIALTGFWWLTMWLLLGGRIAWRELLPSAIATAIFWVGMSIVFRLTMSSTIMSNYAKYGAIGVMLALMSFLIAIGVVIILGAVVGVVWRARRTSGAKTGSAGGSG
jgi:membrane protein